MKKKINAVSVICASALLFVPIVAFADNDGDKTDKDVPTTVKTMEGDSTSVQEVMKERALGEVVVTTQKRHQNTIEIPTSVSAITGSMLGSLNINQMDQVAAFIPGIQIQQQSPNNSGYAIRGVTSDDGTATSQPRVSVFLDGVSNFRTQSSQVELFDLDRVEVTKGPQGTLFGRGAEIGAIDIIRKKPTNKLGGEFSINGGTRGQFGVTGMLNTPIISNRLINRFAFSYDRHDGYIKNEAGGRLNGKCAIALRNSTRLYAGDNTKLDLVLDYQHDSYPGTSFKSKLFAPENGYAATAGTFSPNSSANLEEGKWLGIHRNIGGGQLSLSSKLNEAWTLNTITGLRGYNSDENFDADGTNLPLLKCTEHASGFQASQEVRFNYDAGKNLKGFVGASYFYENVKEGVTLNTNMQYLYPAYIQSLLKSQVGSSLNHDSYQQIVAMVNNFDFSALTGGNAAQAAYLKNQIVTALNGYEETILGTVEQLFSAGEFGKSLTNVPDFYGTIDTFVQGLTSQLGLGQGVGLDYLFSLMGVDSSSTTGQYIAAIKQISGAQLPENYGEDMTNYAQNHAVDVFADASYTIVKGLTATVGLRATYEHQRSGYSSSTDTSLNPFNCMMSAFYYHPTADGQTVWTSKSYWSWVGRFALNYMYKRNNIYATISRGRRPGVIEFNNTPDEITSLKPEIIWNYEAGIKGYATRNLYYDLCFYYYDWYHFQSSVVVDDANTMSKVNKNIDAGRAHSLGFEGTLRYAPCNFFNVFGSYAYNDAKFNDTDENGNAQDYAGNSFRLTPKHTVSLGANFTLPTSENAFLYFTPTYTWKSKVYFTDDNDEDLTQHSFGLMNFTLGYHFSPNKVSYDVSVYGRNVLNKDYIVDAGNTGRNINFPTYIGGAPSVFGAMLKVSF